MFMRILFAICLVICITACNSSGKKNKNDSDTSALYTLQPNDGSSIRPVKLTEGDLPASIRFKGKLYEAWQWNDGNGKNILITSFVAPYAEKSRNPNEEEIHSAEIHAFHFIYRDTGYVKLWQMSDAEKACPFDITAEFIKDAIAVTDLDMNGIAETWLQYKLACRSDVSPAYMKIIMHQDTLKFGLRGLMWVQTGEKDSFAVTENDMNLEKLPRPKDEYDQLMQRFGRYETEKDFAYSATVYLTYARKQWMKHVKESFE
jgi:hypothetical protein